MPVNEFYGYQVAVYVVIVLISFLLAWFFWRKGDAIISGKVPGSEATTYKITGAAAIFLVTLFVLHYINPLHPLSDYRNVVLLSYNAAPVANLGGKAIQHVDAETLKNMMIDQNKVLIEVVWADGISSLLPSVNNRYETDRPLAAGRYRLRVFESETGKWKEKFISLPEENRVP